MCDAFVVKLGCCEGAARVRMSSVLVGQDFEALTPNLLARTVETVEGGGLVVLLLRSVDSLRQLYTMTMVRAARLLLFSQFSQVRKQQRFQHSCQSCFQVTTPNKPVVAKALWGTDHKSFEVITATGMFSPQDVHMRYRTEAHQDVVGRFNERCVFCCPV